MKSRQFCSVCKEWLEMEVVPTSDGDDDDGVIWFRCPQCQGFLPKLSGADLQGGPAEGSAEGSAEDPADDISNDIPNDSGTEVSPPGEKGPETALPSSDSPSVADTDEDLLWDSPADMMAARDQAQPENELPARLDPVEDDSPKEGAAEPSSDQAEEPPEPLHEYAALLAEKDQSQPTPYRPWESYEVGQCIHHQAWEECGVVVAKEKLPGNRQVIKCYFEEAGVVRLIEMAPR